MLRHFARLLGQTPALKLLLPLALGTHLVWGGYGQGAWLLLSAGLVLFVFACLAFGWRGARLGAWHSLKQVALHCALFVSLTAISMLYVGARGGAGHRTRLGRVEDGSFRAELLEQGKQLGLSSEVERLTAAIALGYTARDIDTQAMRQSFALSGSAHILAVSGYHLALIVGVVAWMLGWLRSWAWGRRLYFLLLIVFAWGFTALTGWGVPTVRAAVMLSLFLVAKLWLIPVKLPQVLALSAVLQLLYEPILLYSYGMWLSYMAVLSIYLYMMPIYRSVGSLHKGLVAWLWQALSVTLSVQIYLLPLCLYIFGYVSWSFLFTCLPMTLLSVLLIPLALLAYLCAYLSCAPPLLGLLVEWLGQAMLSVARYGEALSSLVQRMEMPLWGLLLCWLVASLYPLWLSYRRAYR